MAVNYQKELEAVISEMTEKGERRKLLLQVCCAPCSSYCLEYLREYFDITVLYYNPNIEEKAEFEKRRAEELRLIECYNEQVRTGDFAGMHSTGSAGLISVMDCPHEPEAYERAVVGLHGEPEGGKRCEKCFALRLGKTAELAKQNGFDCFSTTLTISPLKNAALLNTIGRKLAEEYGIAFLPSDFKKKDGYRRSIELSRQFGLYRQDYCGCIYSREERARQKAEAAKAEGTGKA